MKPNRPAIFAIALGVAAAFAAQSALAADQKFGPDAQKLSEAQHRGIEFLKASQADDGTWTSNTSTGVTALAITALLKSGVPMTDRTVVKGLAALEKYVQKDGGIYHPKTSHKNYETCVAVVAVCAGEPAGTLSKTPNANSSVRMRVAIVSSCALVTWPAATAVASAEP